MKQLKENLPSSCYEAIEESLKIGGRKDLNESVYREYFDSQPTPILTESEQHELFEQLGNDWIKNHFSTEQLRSFLDSEPSVKKGRNHG